jgi:hypothetical protein
MSDDSMMNRLVSNTHTVNQTIKPASSSNTVEKKNISVSDDEDMPDI